MRKLIQVTALLIAFLAPPAAADLEKILEEYSALTHDLGVLSGLIVAE